MVQVHLIALLVASIGYYLALAGILLRIIVSNEKEDVVERELIQPAKRRRELARREVMYELMDEQICRKNLRMSPYAFKTLCELLRGTGLIRDNQYSYVEEQVSKCLHVLAHGTRCSLSSLLYRRSSETVSLHYYMRWTGEMDKIMLEVLREQKTKGQKNDRNFSSHAYGMACDALKKQYNVKLTSDKLQNRLKTLKKDLGLVLDLITKKSGFTWDDTKKKIIASNDLWANVIKADKNFKQIRDKEFHNLDLLREIFEKDQATDNEAESAKEKLQRWQKERTQFSIDELDQMQARQEIHLESFDQFVEVSLPTNSKEECSSSRPKPKSKTLKRKAVDFVDVLVSEISE